MATKSIAIVSGFGAQNIGNAFFNVGGLSVMRRVFPGHNVQLIQDQPGYWTFNRARRNPKNYCEMISRLEVEYIVLQGPVFSSTLPKLWDETLDRLYAKGTRVIYLSSALFKYTPDEIELAKRFLEKYPPAFVSTRDAASYDELKDATEIIYNGICSAWFVPDVYRPIPLGPEKIVTFNFDRMPEPTISRGTHPEAFSNIEIFGEEFSLSMPALQYACSKRGKSIAYIGALLDRRRLPATFGTFDIVRPEHRTNPHLGWKIYGQPGGLASDEPYTYFNTYANTHLTLSDRVHACVMTLAYGNQAMLFSLSPRSRLFDRMGLSEIRERPVKIDLQYLEDQKADQIAFLKSAVQSAQ